MKGTKKLSICVLLVLLVMNTTGCGNFIKYHLREDPEKAMERYLEEKYDDEFTLISWSIEDTFNFYWDKTGFSGRFESEKYPGKEIVVGASALKDGFGYKFWDNYLKRTYVDTLDEIMVETAGKYFTEEYYVYTHCVGMLGADTDPVMSFEEYVADDYHFGVCIFVEEMEDEAALQAMEGFRDDIIGRGILCDFELGRINQEDISKEEFLRKMEEEGEAFNPWMTFGSEHYTNWIYQEWEGEIQELESEEPDADSGDI